MSLLLAHRTPEGKSATLEFEGPVAPGPVEGEAYFGVPFVHVEVHSGVPSHCSPNWLWTIPSPQYGATVQAVVQRFGP